MSVHGALQRLTADRRASRWAVLAGVALALPSLAGGLQVDDHWHAIALRGHPAWPEFRLRAWDVFRFFDGSPVHNQALMDRGVVAWWTDLDVRVAFVRPLSSLTHALDHRLFPGAPWAMHLHSILWFAALLAVASALIGRFLSGTARGLAALFYAVSCARGVTVGWIAQRNSLVAGTLALGAILLHDRASKREGSALHGPLLFAFALLGGESALAALGVLVAHAWFVDPRPRPWRFLVPYGAVFVGWAVLYRALGGGVRHSSGYTDPLANPLRFARGAAVHLPLLLGGELGAPLPDAWPAVGLGPRVAMVVLACVALAFAIRALTDRLDRFFLAAALLSVLPGCATFPSGRLLTIPGVMLVCLQARLVTRLLEGELRGSLRAWATWVLGGRLLLGPVLFLVTAMQFALLEHRLHGLSESVPDDLARRPALYVVNGPGFLTAYAPVHRSRAGVPSPRVFGWLGIGMRPLTIRRIDARTLELRTDGALFGGPLEMLATDPERRFLVGERIVLPDVTVTVRSTTVEGRPDAVTFTFGDDVDAVSRGFVAWQGIRYVRWTPPPIGASSELAAQPLFSLD